MTCPNCGLENPPGARFCGNCGTSFTGTPPPPPQYNAPYTPPGGGPYNMGGGGRQQITPARAIGLGCLIIVVLFFLFFFSCTRACFGRRRYYRYMRYSHVLVIPPQVNSAPIIQA